MKELLVRGKSFVVPENHPKSTRLSLVGFAVLLLVFWMASISSAAPEYDASDVDSPPRIVRKMPVSYPASAKRNGVEGKVLVRVLIGTDGRAGKMEVVESEPEGIFDENALKSLIYWQFRPGIKSGKLVATWVNIPLTFKID